MYAVSDSFKAALRSSHRITTSAELWTGGSASAASELVTTLEVIDGGVTVDRAAACRRACSLTLLDRDGTLTPSTLADALAPNGAEVHVYRGVLGEQDVPQGIFGIDDVDIGDTPQGLTLSLQGFDRAKAIQRAKLTDLHVIDEGINYADAILDLLVSRFPTLVSSFMTTEFTTPQITLDEQADPWVEAVAMARAIGAELFFAVSGVAVLQPEFDPASVAVDFEYSEGAEAMILGVSRKLSREGVFNHVIVTGEPVNGATPVRAEAIDDDPSSPTYIDGAFGDVPYFETSELVTTEEQAQAMADALLLSKRRVVESLSFPTIVNPAHDGGDVVTVTRARANVSGRYVLEAFNVPMTASESMTAAVRAA